ncbi:hypothetical protein BX666DRAFT_1881013 [Dichotomocladium elegans]|nr:hypothetical protein BX666DRAFT_1881013 [Dichotomocladium elegans]
MQRSLFARPFCTCTQLFSLAARQRAIPISSTIATRLYASKTVSSNAASSGESAGKVTPMSRPPRDEEITARFITFVDDKGQVLEQRIKLSQVLGQMDRQKYFLVQVTGGQLPVCRLFEKKAMFERQKAKKKNSKASESAVTKEIMFGWHVSDHDMEHKLRHAKQFLEKGNKVKIEIVAKKNQVRPTKEEQMELVGRVKAQFAEYKATKAPAFSGATCIMQFEKK